MMNAEVPQDIHQRMMDFASRVIRMYEALPEQRGPQHAGVQVLRSATSAGAQRILATMAINAKQK